MTETLLKTLGLKGGAIKRQMFEKSYTPVVSNSDDLKRIAALPRRPVPSIEQQQAMAAVMTARLRRENPNCQCAQLRPEVVAQGKSPCILHLNPVQGWYLWEASALGYAAGNLIVGSGKTGIDIMAAMAIPGVKKAVLLIPPKLRTQFARDFKCWSQHFQTPNLAGGLASTFVPGRPVLTVLAYSELSHKTKTAWLEAHKPDLIVGDEVQALRNPGVTRTDRVIRLFMALDEVGFCMHTDSLTTDSIDDFAHLLALCMKKNSPAPIDRTSLAEFCGVLDPNPPEFYLPGPMKVFQERPDEPIRQAFRRRMIETPGFISTTDTHLPIKLKIFERKLEVPKEVRQMLTDVRAKSMRPDGEILREELEVVAALKAIASGFFHIWRFPRGEERKLIDEWYAARKEWNAAVRDKLFYRTDHMDSPGLLEDAARRWSEGYKGPLPIWECDEFLAWEKIRDKVQPQPDAIWKHDFLAEDAAAWAKEKPGIVWVKYPIVGRRIAKLAGIPYFGAGDESSAEIERERGDRSIVASMGSHGQGLNLQYAFNRNLFTYNSSDCGVWQQGIGRTFRPYQTKDEVEVFLYRHTAEFLMSFRQARTNAEYVREISYKIEALLLAEYNFEP